MHEYKVDGIIKALIWQEPHKIESSAWDQIKLMAQHECIKQHIAFMPDIHMGVGATIGSVIPFDDCICPPAVGSDIGCGMLSCKTDLKASVVSPKLKEIIRSIKRSIPLGYSWRNNNQLSVVEENIDPQLKKILDELKEYKNTLVQLGTLGGGNHFIELESDEEDNLWITIHSGSRNFGKTVADEYHKKAKEQSQYGIPKDLEILERGTGEFNDYFALMKVCVAFAADNRRIIASAVKKEIEHYFGPFKFVDVVHTPHNYAIDTGGVILHRKGATSANLGERGVIPGSSGTPSYIVKGRGNALSYNSCSHGAGRIMSRGKAKKEINMEDFKASMNGVISEDVNVGHLDEAPQAYKNIDEIMDQQKDLVEIEVKLTPIGNVKG